MSTTRIRSPTPDAIAPIRMAFNPGVECRLGLLEQRHVSRYPALVRGLGVSSRATKRSKEAGTVTSAVCSSSGSSSWLRIPGLTKVIQILLATQRAATASRLLGCAQRKECRTARYACDRIQPRLRRRNQPRGNFRAALLGELANHECGARPQAAALVPAGKSAGPEIYKKDGSSGSSRTSPG